MRMALLDWDLTRWRTPTVFNLELMKIATYYKNRNHIVEMIRRHTPGKFKKVFISKDYEDFEYPDELTQNEDVIWTGLALTNGIYIPMETDLELSRPDTLIYERMKPYYKQAIDGRKIFNMMTNAHHLRLMYDDPILKANWERQIDKERKAQHIIFHDPKLHDTPELFDLINYTMSEYGSKAPRIGFKFPVTIDNPDNLRKWCAYPKVNSVNNILVSHLIPLDILEGLKGSQNITYYFDLNNTIDEIISSLGEILLQGVYIRKNNVKLGVRVSPQVPLSMEWRHVIEFINNYLQCRYCNDFKLNWCPYTHCKYIYNKWAIEDKYYYFNYVKENNYNLFDLFYNLEYVVREGNALVPHMYTGLEDYLGGIHNGTESYKRKDNGEQQNYSTIIQPQYIYSE